MNFKLEKKNNIELVYFFIIIPLIILSSCTQKIEDDILIRNDNNFSNNQTKIENSTSNNLTINKTLEIKINYQDEAEYEITYARNLAYITDNFIEENEKGVSKIKEKQSIQLLKNATLLIYEAQELYENQKFLEALDKAKEARRLIVEAKRIY